MGLNLPAASSYIPCFQSMGVSALTFAWLWSKFFMIFRPKFQTAITKWKVVRKPHSYLRLGLLGKQSLYTGLWDHCSSTVYISAMLAAPRGASHCHTQCPASLPRSPWHACPQAPCDCGESRRHSGQPGWHHSAAENLNTCTAASSSWHQEDQVSITASVKYHSLNRECKLTSGEAKVLSSTDLGM